MADIKWAVKPVLDDDGSGTIRELHWRCTATGENEETGAAYGSVDYAAPGEPFIPLENIDLATVKDWVVAADDAFESVADIEAAANGRLQRLQALLLEQPAPGWEG